MNSKRHHKRRHATANTESADAKTHGGFSFLRSPRRTRQHTAGTRILARGMLRAVFGVTLILLLGGCASPSGYFADRGRDAADIFTATVGAGVGAKARLGFLQTGLLINNDLYGFFGIDIYADDIGLWKPSKPDDIKQRGASGFVRRFPIDESNVTVESEKSSSKLVE